MFSGLIADVGEVKRLDAGADGMLLRVGTALSAEIVAGDSVCVSGACLTAVEVDSDGFAAEVSNQTLSVTSLGGLSEGDPVNIELALRAADRLGGHIVQGHVDATGETLSFAQDGFSRRLRVAAEPEIRRYLVERGSIAVDGVSLTVAALEDGWFEVALVPETLERTTLGDVAPGRRLNLEVDILARYVERLAPRIDHNSSE